ncbi:MAG: DUF427 domain-containing protein, partial [Ilumatobacteraceae bacterium]
MGLTIADGPLAPNAAPSTNYTIDGPKHRIFFSAFPRRVRAELAGKVVLETDGGMLLHETALLPQLYVPIADIDDSLLEPTDHTTHCPFKGDASYHTIRVGDTARENGVWTYPEPLDAVPWLSGYRALYWSAVDAWFDEDEKVFGHLRDPFHRVDARPTRRHVTVTLDDRVLAESTTPMVVSETGLPNRWYLAADDLRVELGPSDTATVCPYKGDASYGSVDEVADVAWCYRDPLP